MAAPGLICVWLDNTYIEGGASRPPHNSNGVWAFTKGGFAIPAPANRNANISAGFESFFKGAPPGCIRLTVGEPDFPTPREVVEAAKADLDAGDTHYVPTAGKDVLLIAIQAKLKADNALDYGLDEITVTVGAKEALVDASLALLDPGDEVLVPAPYWPSYDAIAAFAGARTVAVPTEAGARHLDLEALKAAASPRTKAVLVNSPNNPTGAVYAREELKALVDLACDRDLFIFSDEIYEHMVYGGRRHFALAAFPGAFERTVTVNGFSKAFAMTGWRLGYTAAPRALAVPMRRVHMHAVTHPSSFEHRAAAVALTRCGESVRAMVAEYDRRRKLIHERLDRVRGWRCPEPEGAFYAFPDIRGTGLTSSAVFERLLEAGVQVIPGHLFPGGEGALRLSYATSTENLETAAARIERAFGHA
ncbi:MAG TPA: pyridoxal phosphate-dependent aminotransferase [Candidatus Thermoplasmatota archaeon]|nr:pyridoxal phosphate-dependent aminotransferase [Candidatus Thermoplasmatota archaeon]